MFVDINEAMALFRSLVFSFKSIDISCSDADISF